MGTKRKKGCLFLWERPKGKKLFDGSLLTVKYFFDVLDMELWKALLIEELDFEGDVFEASRASEETFEAGKNLVWLFVA